MGSMPVLTLTAVDQIAKFSNCRTQCPHFKYINILIYSAWPLNDNSNKWKKKAWPNRLIQAIYILKSCDQTSDAYFN